MSSIFKPKIPPPPPAPAPEPTVEEVDSVDANKQTAAKKRRTSDFGLTTFSKAGGASSNQGRKTLGGS